MPAGWLKTLRSGFACRAVVDRIGGASAQDGLRSAAARLWPHISAHRALAAWGALFICLSTAIGFAPPLVSRYLVDEVILGRQMGLLAAALGVLAACLAAEKLLRFAEDYCFSRFEQQVLLGIQDALLARTFELPKAFFDAHPSGYLTRRLTEDLEGLRIVISGAMVQAVSHLLRLVGGALFLFYLEWRLAAVVLVLLPAMAWGLRFFASRIHDISRHRLEIQAEAAGRIQESLADVAGIKAFAGENLVRERIMALLGRVFQASLEQSLISSLSAILTNSIPGFGRLVVLGAGAVLIVNERWTLGSLMAFQAYLTYVFGPAQYLSSMNLQMQRAFASLERVSAFLDIVPEDTRKDGVRVEKLRGEIEFRNVSFSYDPSSPVLDNVSFWIRAGEIVAVMGATGVGKTTLISLLLGFYRSAGGEIYFDGRPASAYELRSLRRRLGYVPQAPRLITGSILCNLRYGQPEATVESVLSAAGQAGMHEEILGFPEGYQTVVGNGGAALSEGQKQRMALARALVADPDILILDEPTASLDNSTENSMLKSLLSGSKGRTIILVTHRLSTASFCDRIFHLDRKNTSNLGLAAEGSL